ncbi:hypothetical protein V6N12_023948 [Hibiscus sabdariffa]|uniref:Uncharacterized protein n=1 Tax=Hibiscus sabdariffa TaxID=183260 RepID=A0ABR2FZ58_9ROSI
MPNGIMNSLKAPTLWKSKVKVVHIPGQTNKVEDEICEKLDKVLSYLEWGFLFPRAIVVIDVVITSDHAPIVLLTNGMMKNR